MVNGMISNLSQALIPLESVLAGTVLQMWGSSVLLFLCVAGFVISALWLLIQSEIKTI